MAQQPLSRKHEVERVANFVLTKSALFADALFTEQTAVSFVRPQGYNEAPTVARCIYYCRGRLSLTRYGSCLELMPAVHGKVAILYDIRGDTLLLMWRQGPSLPLHRALLKRDTMPTTLAGLQALDGLADQVGFHCPTHPSL